MPMFERVVIGGLKSRQRDAFGSGQFGAHRTGHRHGSTHEGLDIVASAHSTVFSPIDGVLVREARPYGAASPFAGVVIQGTGAWQDYEVKMFYVSGYRSGTVSAGETIGVVQDLEWRYPGITNHIHVEVRKGGTLLSPADLYGMCF